MTLGQGPNQLNRTDLSPGHASRSQIVLALLRHRNMRLQIHNDRTGCGSSDIEPGEGKIQRLQPHDIGATDTSGLGQTSHSLLHTLEEIAHLMSGDEPPTVGVGEPEVETR
ncbi:hypothetical protein SGR_1874 [Streptomyces griseus subsp. griseus NBRC 13350]|uniref:Uncharacterized protein n=1 Tax=Streptomyces griseus subsp. griseus (strain JCM 4626 / CBS 651.72 / NBRC 13350 / KCC S-0626 / ISP 5235) TaxID=455632 RepID=B1VYU8_STRGG|nr:hypothetical protein SGR_1874 [Streptomyces griseus subsp. griseus NBRC 13350]